MLGIIINPKSGKKAFRAQRIYLWHLLRKRHLPFAYRVTKYANHAIELARELVEKGRFQRGKRGFPFVSAADFPRARPRASPRVRGRVRQKIWKKSRRRPFWLQSVHKFAL